MCPFLQETIKEEIGEERFVKILAAFSQDRMYMDALEQPEICRTEFPQLITADFQQILFDRQFCLLYKSIQACLYLITFENNHD